MFDLTGAEEEEEEEEGAVGVLYQVYHTVDWFDLSRGISDQQCVSVTENNKQLA